jgi:HK97 gp10 family phage protein
MIGLDVDTSDLEEIAHNLNDAAKILPEVLGKVVSKSADRIVELAKQFVPQPPGAPYAQGDLKASIHKQEVGNLGVAVGTAAPYAAYVEFGTHKMRPQPFLYPAVGIVMPEMRPKLTEAAVAVIEGHGRKWIDAYQRGGRTVSGHYRKTRR